MKAGTLVPFRPGRSCSGPDGAVDFRGPARHPHSGRQALAADLAQELLIALRPALREPGDWEEIEHLLADALRDGRRTGSHTGAILTQGPKRGRKLALEP